MFSADFIRQGRPDTNQGAPSSTQTATSGAPSTDTDTNEHKRVQTDRIIITPAPEGEAAVVRKILERYPYHIAFVRLNCHTATEPSPGYAFTSVACADRSTHLSFRGEPVPVPLPVRVLVLTSTPGRHRPPRSGR
jgi:hypothetical protein